MKESGATIIPSNTAACDIEIRQDGHIIVSIGVCDIGGGHRSSVAQIAASLLGVPLEDVTLRLADTAMTPPVGATAGSKTLYYCSNAAFMAANALRKRLLEVAADRLEVRVDDLVLQDGEIRVKDQSGKTLALLD